MDYCKKFFLSVSTNDALISKISVDVDKSTIERSVAVEKDSIIQIAMVSDVYDDVNLIVETDIVD